MSGNARIDMEAEAGNLSAERAGRDSEILPFNMRARQYLLKDYEVATFHDSSDVRLEMPA
jgi:hypothetical protein